MSVTEKKKAAGIPRVTILILPVLMVAGTVAFVVPKVGDHEGEKNPVFSSTTREVTYEALGKGVADEITYTYGEKNAAKTLTKVLLPWKKTVVIPVGIQGGTANLYVGNPRNDTTITCRIAVAGRVVKEVNATDGYVDPACSVQLQSQRVDQ